MNKRKYLTFNEFLAEYREEPHRKNRWEVVPPSEYAEHKDEFFELIKTAYAEIGGHLKVKSPEDVFADPDWNFWRAIDIDSDPDIDVIKIAKNTQYGKKSVAVGHDGSKDAKKTYLNQTASDMKHVGNFGEVSGKLAEILLTKYGVPEIDNKETVEKIVGKEVEWVGKNPEGLPGNGWYNRTIAGKKHLKLMVGKPKSLPVKESVPPDATSTTFPHSLAEPKVSEEELVVYFHGFETLPTGEKVDWLHSQFTNVYAPHMTYKEKPDTLFTEMYEKLKGRQVKFIVGSSMGGYFAYWMGKKLGVPVIAFNPALNARTHSHILADESGTEESFANIVLGESDHLISPLHTQQWLKSHAKFGTYKITMASMEHRVPFELFKKFILKFA